MEDNSLDLYALHYVIMDVLQEHLIDFKNGWAKPSYRTEHNRAPMQLWVMGLLDMDQVLLGDLEFMIYVFMLFLCSI